MKNFLRKYNKLKYNKLVRYNYTSILIATLEIHSKVVDKNISKYDKISLNMLLKPSIDKHRLCIIISRWRRLVRYKFNIIINNCNYRINNNKSCKLKYVYKPDKGPENLKIEINYSNKSE